MATQKITVTIPTERKLSDEEITEAGPEVLRAVLRIVNDAAGWAQPDALPDVREYMRWEQK